MFGCEPNDMMRAEPVTVLRRCYFTSGTVVVGLCGQMEELMGMWETKLSGLNSRAKDHSFNTISKHPLSYLL